MARQASTDTTSGDLRWVSMHDGDGKIGIKSLFRGLTTTGIHLDFWVIPAGASEGSHTHFEDAPSDAYEEIYYVIEGRGIVDIGSSQVTLDAGDAVLIPVGTRHGVRTLGDQDLRLLLIFALSKSG